MSWNSDAATWTWRSRSAPGRSKIVVQCAWAGLYEMTPDHNPIIGPARDISGFFLINGFSGHGFQHSPAAGRILADLVTGADPGLDLTPFTFDRFAGRALAGERYVV